MEHEGGKGEPFVIAGQPRKASRPRKGPLHHSAARQKDETTPGLVMRDHLPPQPVFGRRRLLARLALIHIRQLDVSVRRLLQSPGQVPSPVRDPARWPQSLRAPADDPAFHQRREPLILSASWPRRSPARPPLSGVDWSGRLWKLAVLGTAFLPAASRCTARRSMAPCARNNSRAASAGSAAALPATAAGHIGHHPPRTARPDKPAQSVAEFAQGMLSLRSVLLHQGQVGSAKAPFFIAYSTGITPSCLRHPDPDASSLLPGTAFSYP